MKNKKANLEKKHPNTFIIGFPKCGTTALSNFLGQHPEVYFSPEKETSVYQNSVQIRKISYERYLKMFEPADLSKHKVIAEGGIRNICTETGISEILRSKPNAKFILCHVPRGTTNGNGNSLVTNEIVCKYAEKNEFKIINNSSKIFFTEIWPKFFFKKNFGVS